MTYKEAINASQIWAARGFNEKGEAVVSVAYYGDELRWLEGWGGNWAKSWKPVPEEDLHKLDKLVFHPYGAKPDDQIHEEMLASLGVIYDGYERDDADKENSFEPFGEFPED